MSIKFALKISFIAIVFSSCMKSKKVDLIIHNAQIYTLDISNTIQDAIAIKDGKIVEVGPERQILNKYRSDETINAKQQFIFPGFIDAHCHFYGYGLTNSRQAKLNDCKSFDEVLDILKSYAETNQSSWIFGRGWDQTRWKNTAFPTKEKLDSLFPNTPVYLTRIDGHAALVNTASLKIAGIENGKIISGGEMLMKNGSPTGLLIDNAMELVIPHFPEISLEESIKALLLAQDECFKHGLTTVDDAGLNYKIINLIDSLQQAGDLKMKIYAMLSDEEENYDD